MAEKTVTEQLNDISASLEIKAKADAKAAADAALVEVKDLLKTAETKADNAEKEAAELKGQVKVLKDAADKNQEALDSLILSNKKKPLGGNGGEEKSFNEILGETIERNMAEIKNFKRGAGERRFDLLPEVKSVNNEGEREVKAVGDMTIAANFPNAGSIYQDVRSTIVNPYNRVWLSDVLPGGTSDKPVLTYPKENGGEGAAALWEDPTQDKAQMDFDITTKNSYFKWIAGIVIVDREMLDDIPFMTSYIQQKMLISLKTAENAFILNGSDPTKSNPVDGLLDVATAYSGSFTNPVDMLLDAAYGQIVEDTEEFYMGTTLVTMPRQAVAMGLNKAAGSGEYDLPNGVTFANGKIQVGGLDLVPTTKIGAGNFLAFDKSATMYIRRMSPELRLFEDSILAKKNKVMFRIEGRSTLAILNNAAIVKGTFA